MKSDCFYKDNAAFPAGIVAQKAVAFHQDKATFPVEIVVLKGVVAGMVA